MHQTEHMQGLMFSDAMCYFQFCLQGLCALKTCLTVGQFQLGHVQTACVCHLIPLFPRLFLHCQQTQGNASSLIASSTPLLCADQCDNVCFYRGHSSQ